MLSTSGYSPCTETVPNVHAKYCLILVTGIIRTITSQKSQSLASDWLFFWI